MVFVCLIVFLYFLLFVEVDLVEVVKLVEELVWEQV